MLNRHTIRSSYHRIPRLIDQARASAGNDVAEASSATEGDASTGMSNGATPEASDTPSGAPIGISSPDGAANPDSNADEGVASTQLRLSVQVVTGIDKVRT